MLSGGDTTRQDILCSPSLPEPELTPPRCLDPDRGTTNSPVDPESVQDPWLQEDPRSRRSWAESSSSSSESKKHCAEDPREQKDRSTITAVASVLADTMAPVIPQYYQRRQMRLWLR